MTADRGRYAIYFSPDRDSALGIFGRHWLGYDADSGEATEQSALATLSPQRLAEITAEPSRYGFHATLKPPFVLAAGRSIDELSVAMEALAAQCPPVLAPPLTLASISGFWSLVPSRPCRAIDLLAEDCVRRFDAFRAPPSDDELAKRRRAPLTATQEALLVHWGYPYVMDEFRFHMTLTARLAAPEASRLEAILSPLVAPLCGEALRIDATGLFHQPAPEEHFRLVRRYRLAGTISTLGS